MSTVATTDPATTRPRSWSRIACAASAVGAVAPFALLELTGDSGAEITAGLVDDRLTLILGTYVAVLVSAGLFVAAVHLGRRVPDVGGALVTAAGSAVALMYAAYYGVFGAGAVIASGESGPGLGEAAWHALNLMEIARYAPGLALVVAGVAAGASLPRAVRVTAAVLVVLTLVPLTSWVAALLIPVWLGVSAAVTIPRSPARP
jgi:hypothetical protein